MKQETNRPIPDPDEVTKPFWDAAKKHQLVVQKCGDCGFYSHPPRPTCDNCSSENLSFQKVSGRGKIYSYTTCYTQHIQEPYFGSKVPYLLVTVELDEQDGLLMDTELPGADKKDIKVGAPVEVIFEDVTDEITLPQFKLVKGKK